MSTKKLRRTITFQPAPDVQRMIARAARMPNGHQVRGFVTHLINRCLRDTLIKEGWAGKKDLAV